MKLTNTQHPPKKTWIKICGFTQIENARECADFGPDAIGLVFFEKSPRNISIEQAAKITAILPKSVMPVGVFVDKSHKEIMHIVHKCNLKGVQLHGNESPDLVDKLTKENLVVIKALFAQKAPYLDQAAHYDKASYFLIEYGKGILPGGNAESWDYEIASQLETNTPIILAGGLDPDTVANAVRKAKPTGVDVSSGVEKTHGIKDVEKVKSFINQINAL